MLFSLNRSVIKMPVLPRFNLINVHQVDPNYGCTVWAMEWLIRYKGSVYGNWEIPQGELDFFQYRFNLHEQTDGDIENTFPNVLEIIREFYPHIGLIHCNTYGNNQAVQKYQQIEQLITQGIPCITSIRLLSQPNAHVVPVIEINSNDVRVIWGISTSGVLRIGTIAKTSLFQMHSAGRGIAFMYLP